MAKVHDEGYGHQGSNYILGEKSSKMALPSKTNQSVRVPGSHTNTGIAGESGSDPQYETGYGEHHDGHLIDKGYNVDDGMGNDPAPGWSHDHLHHHLDEHKEKGHFAYLERNQGAFGAGLGDADEGYYCGPSFNLHGSESEGDDTRVGGMHETERLDDHAPMHTGTSHNDGKYRVKHEDASTYGDE